jgi:alpha-D-xyloside xylohydrolase
MRPCFYDFPDDERCWDIEEEYMYREKYLCCPIFKLGQRKIKVYLPKGASWGLWSGGTTHSGGQFVEVECPFDTMPVFIRQ